MLVFQVVFEIMVLEYQGVYVCSTKWYHLVPCVPWYVRTYSSTMVKLWIANNGIEYNTRQRVSDGRRAYLKTIGRSRYSSAYGNTAPYGNTIWQYQWYMCTVSYFSPEMCVTCLTQCMVCMVGRLSSKAI